MRRFRPASPSHHPVTLRFQRPRLHPRVPLCSSRERNPWSPCFQETEPKHRCWKNRPSSKLRLLAPHSTDPYKCRKLLCSYPPFHLLFSEYLLLGFNFKL